MIPRYIGVPLIFEEDYTFDKSVALPKLEKITSISKDFDNYGGTLELGNAGSTAGNHLHKIHEQPEFDDFSTWALKKAHNILSYRWNFEFDYIEITRSWSNRHKKGGWTNYHTHANCDLVLAAYVQAPPECGDLVIIDPMENHWFGMSTKMNSRSPLTYNYPAQDNRVYFFAPFLRHGTQPSNADEDRWVISMNFNCWKGKP
jgi:uncharacterized protein (TIGR02466 family)